MNIEIFKSEDFGEVRVIKKDNEPWFVAKDISEKLEYSETSVMLIRLDDDETIKIEPTEIVGTNNMAREITVINEGGLYNAILGYKDVSDSMKRHIDDEDKLTRCFTDSGQSRGIKSYVEILTSAKMRPLDFFIENTKGEISPWTY